MVTCSKWVQHWTVQIWTIKAFKLFTTLMEASAMIKYDMCSRNGSTCVVLVSTHHYVTSPGIPVAPHRLIQSQKNVVEFPGYSKG